MINLQNLFRKNLPVKILALIASIIMWGYVMNEENPSVNGRYTVPVNTNSSETMDCIIGALKLASMPLSSRKMESAGSSRYTSSATITIKRPVAA